MVPILINNNEFETHYTDLKFIAPNHNSVCTNLIYIYDKNILKCDIHIYITYNAIILS